MKNTNTNTACWLLLLLLFVNVCFSQNVTTAGGTASTGSSNFLCVAGGFSQVSNINSASTADWTNFSLIAGAGCRYWIHSTLNGTGTAGTFAGYCIRAADLINILPGIQLQTYHSGTLQETANSNSLIVFTDVGGTYLLFQTTKPYSEVRLLFSGLALVAYNMDIFFGFGMRELPGTILPVKFGEMKAERNQASVRLNFQLDTDPTTKIEIERSADAQHFTSIATVPFQLSGKFTFNDISSVDSYYRIMATDHSGRHYSNIIKAQALETVTQLKFVRRGINAIVQIGSRIQETGNYCLMDEQGRMVYQGKKLVGNASEITLPSTLQVGRIYFFTLVTVSGKRTTIKWVE